MQLHLTNKPGKGNATLRIFAGVNADVFCHSVLSVDEHDDNQ